MMRIIVRDGPLENLGGGGRSTKKKSRKRKLNEKKSFTLINPKKYSCYGLKKFIQESMGYTVPMGVPPKVQPMFVSSA